MNGDESKQGQAVFSTTAEGERQNNSVECHGDGVELLGHDKTSGEQPFAAVSVIQQLIPPLDTGLKPGRTIGAIGLAFIAFVSVCGGPFGIEDAVGAAGPLVTLISLLVLGVFWALPQALMTAELSTIYDENGGYIVWVYEALGPFWGFLNGVNSVASNLCDLPLYPVLYSQYLSRYFGFGTPIKWLVKGLALILVVVLNILGMDAVADSSLLFTILVLTPFIIEPFFEAPDPSHWGQTPVGGVSGVDWAVFMSVVLWNFQGWDSMGCFAGEVKNAKRSYPLGVILGTVLIIVNYSLPIMVGLAVDPDWSNWGTGNDNVDFIDMADKIAKWIGVWTVFGASFAVLGEFSAVVSSSSRALQRMSQYRMIPKFLVKNRTRFATPVPAILFEAAATAALMTFDFETLVVLDTFFNNVSLVMEVIAFLVLKQKYPDMPRPYAVPGGILGAWLISIPKFLMIGYTWYSIGLSWKLSIGVGVNLVGIAVGFWWTFRYLPEVHRERSRTMSQNDLSEFEGPFGLDGEETRNDEDSSDAAKRRSHSDKRRYYNTGSQYQNASEEFPLHDKTGMEVGRSPTHRISPDSDLPLLRQRSASESDDSVLASPRHRERRNSYGSFH